MWRRAVWVVVVIAVAGLWTWRSQLFTVSRPGDGPVALSLLPEPERTRPEIDVVLPSVPIGMMNLRSGAGVLLIHYWAPWEHDAATQSTALDSLCHEDGMQTLDAVLVCFDPFPSVARFVGRARLRTPVLLDGEHHLSRRLPCPSVPYTYVLDRSGAIVVAQAGEVDWLNDGTRTLLRGLMEESRVPGSN